MIELHLIGYTSDLRYLVLDLEPEGERGRYRLVVDGDLLLTLDELRDLRAQAGMDVGIPYERLEERLGIVIGGGGRPATTTDAEPAVEEPVERWERVTARPPTSQPPPAPHPEEPAPPPDEPAPHPDEPALPPDEPVPPAVRVVDPTGSSVEEPRPPEVAPWEGAVDEAAVGAAEPERSQELEEPEEPEELDGSEGLEEPERAEEPEETHDAEEPQEPAEPDEVGQPEEPGRPDGQMDGAERPPADAPRAASAGGTAKEAAAPGRDSELTPAQIQARLRAGRRAESVAEEAGTDVAWVERWLPPILTERAQVLQEARSLYLERPRKGRSHAPLGEAVAANLRRRHLDPEEDAEWSVKRRANGRWSINVRYRYRNKTRSATWALDREEGELTASSKAARDLGWADGG